MATTPQDVAPPAITVPAAVSQPFSKSVVNLGFVIGLVLAFLCLAGAAAYLFIYLRDAQHGITDIMNAKSDPADERTTAAIKIMAIHAHNIQARLSLQAGGVFVGMAFGFLGFSLFLLGIKDDMSVDGVAQGVTVKATRLLPGVAVIIAATVLVGASVMHTTPYTFTTPYLTNEPGGRPTGDEKGPQRGPEGTIRGNPEGRGAVVK